MKVEIFISIVALLISLSVLYLNHLKPFKLFVKLGKKIIWVDSRKNFRIDLLITFFNLGMKTGLIENLIIKIETSNMKFTLKPDIFYRLDENRKIVSDEFWRPFLLFGKKEVPKLLGFKSDIQTNSLTDGKFDALLEIFYKKGPESSKIESKVENFRFELNIQEAIKRGLPEQKKPTTIFPFDPKILSNLFSSNKKS